LVIFESSTTSKRKITVGIEAHLESKLAYLRLNDIVLCETCLQIVLPNLHFGLGICTSGFIRYSVKWTGFFPLLSCTNFEAGSRET